MVRIDKYDMYDMYVEIVEGEIISYDSYKWSREPDYETMSVIVEVDEELAQELKRELDIDNLLKFGIKTK